MKNTSVLCMQLAVLCGALSFGGAAFAQAQNPPTPAPTRTWDQITLRLTSYTFRHILTMAREFPEEKYDAKAYAEGRTFIEELWHVTSAAQSTLMRAKGEQVDRPKLASSLKPRTRAEIVPLLESTVAELTALFEKQPNPQVIGLAWDSNEHYAKMVVIFRQNGLVPPTSRPDNKF